MISKKLSIIPLISLLALYPANVFSAPSGGTAVQGGEGININYGGSETVINQNNDKAVINWDSFDIASGETVTFNQASSSNLILNRITGGSPTSILGTLNASGNVFIVNQSGLTVGNGAVINAAGFLASAADIADADFMSGNYSFTGAANPVSNAGKINITEGGYAAFIGSKVVNAGVITARLGSVQLASGTDFRLTFTNDGLIGINVEAGSVNPETLNSGAINADGSVVVMTAKSAAGILANAVNNTGVITAGRISNKDGRVMLIADGGSVNSTGAVTAVKGEVSAASGNINLAGFSAENFTAETSGMITADISSSDISARSSGAGAVNITNRNFGDVYIKLLHSAGQTDYTQINGKNLDFDKNGVSSGAALHLTNSSGNINSDFDFINASTNVTLTALRVSLTKETGSLSLAGSILIKAVTGNLTVNAPGDITLGEAFGSSNLSLTLSSSQGAVTAGGNLLTASSVNAKAYGDITLNGAISRLSAVSSSGNVDVAGTGALSVSLASAVKGTVSLSAAGNLAVYGLTSQNTAVLTASAGASISVSGSGSPLRLKINNGAGSALSIVNNGDINIESWNDGTFTALTLRTLGGLTLPTDVITSSGNVFIQADSVNEGRNMTFASGGDMVLKLKSGGVSLGAVNADIEGENIDITLASGVNFKDLDNDGYSLKGGDINIVSDHSVTFENSVSVRNLYLSAASFAFSGINSFIDASNNISLSVTGDISGVGSFNGENVFLSGNTIGSASGSSIYVKADKGRFEAFAGLGETVNITTYSWYYGVNNFEFITPGSVYLNGKKTETWIYGDIKEARSRDLSPIEENNASELIEYKLLRSFEPENNIIEENGGEREKAGDIKTINGNYEIIGAVLK